MEYFAHFSHITQKDFLYLCPPHAKCGRLVRCDIVAAVCAHGEGIRPTLFVSAYAPDSSRGREVRVDFWERLDASLRRGRERHPSADVVLGKSTNTWLNEIEKGSTRKSKGRAASRSASKPRLALSIARCSSNATIVNARKCERTLTRWRNICNGDQSHTHTLGRTQRATDKWPPTINST